MYPLSAGYSTPSRSKISASKFPGRAQRADDAGAARAEGLAGGVANPNFWKSPGCETTLFFPSGTARVYTRGRRATRAPPGSRGARRSRARAREVRPSRGRVAVGERVGCDQVVSSPGRVL